MHLNAILNNIEKAGNRLPPPTILFVYLCILVLLLSYLASLIGLGAVHPVTQENIVAFNLLSQSGVAKILSHTISNFIQFAPVGSALVAILGIGIADKSGLIAALLTRTVSKAPGRLLTFFIVLAGVLSNIAADTGYVVLIPLAAMMAISAGRHPLVGIAAAFAGVSGGYSANLLIGPVDTILAGITQEAAHLTQAGYEVSATSNYYFMLISTVLVALLGTLVTEFIVSPRLESNPHSFGKTTPQEKGSESGKTSGANQRENKALKAVGLFTLFFAAIILWGLIPTDGILRGEGGNILKSPFIKGIVTIISLYAGLCGVIYGKLSGSLSTNESYVKAMDSTVATMASYLVLMFFAAQFVSYFNWSQLGSIIAIGGASMINSLEISSGILLAIFIFIAALINLFIGSASAKWALLAPVFVPMLMLTGISPEATQVAYRIGDSSTNIITPLMPYFGVVIAFVQQHDKNAGVGTMIAMMLPYSIAFLIGWTALLLGWYFLGLPLGPNASFSM